MSKLKARLITWFIIKTTPIWFRDIKKPKFWDLY